MLASVSADIHEVSASVSYGWGAIPVEAGIDGAAFTTSPFPKHGRYLLPLRDAVPQAAGQCTRRSRDCGDAPPAGSKPIAEVAGRSAGKSGAALLKGLSSKSSGCRFLLDLHRRARFMLDKWTTSCPSESSRSAVACRQSVSGPMPLVDC